MITYIVSPYISQIINNVIELCGQTVMNAIVETKFDFGQFVKQQMGQLQTISHMILDLSVLSDNEEEILIALNNFRILYNARVVILTGHYKQGDKLLSDIFSMGIYDIIPVNEEEEDLLKESLQQSILEGKSYKDSVVFKTKRLEDQAKQGRQTVITREKVVVRNEIYKTANKVLVGFIGTQERIGVTHNAIVSAYYLKGKGNKVAVLERGESGGCFQQIADSFDEVERKEDYFTLNQVDFYPAWPMEEMNAVLARNYNFILIDFGVFAESAMMDFYRCVIQVVVCGSKPWEIGEINHVFESVPEEHLKGFTWLFNFTAPELEQTLKENMSVLRNIFLTDVTPDPFNAVYSSKSPMQNIFGDYISQVEEKPADTKKNRIKDWFKKR